MEFHLQPQKYHTGLAQTTNKYPSSGTERLAESRIIEDHITVGQARNILNADKVLQRAIPKLTWTPSTDWPAKGEEEWSTGGRTQGCKEQGGKA